MTSRVEMSTSTSVLSESEVVIALGSRTTILHPEIKRHRAWWQEILRSRVEEKLAKRVSSPAKDSSSLLVDGQGHAHVRLLEKVAVLLSGQVEDGVFISLGEAAAGVGKGASPNLDLESRELAAVLCGYGGEAGTTRLLWAAAEGADKGTSKGKGKGKARQYGFGGAAAASSLAEKLSGDKVKALGLHVVEEEVGGGSGFIQTFAGKAYEIKHRPAEQQPAAESRVGDVRNAGDGQDSNSSSASGAGRVVLHFCDDLPAAAAQLSAQLERARAWNERHRACFLPIAWAVCATLAAKWPRERMNGASPSPTHEPNEPGARRLSPFSLLALFAAFLDRESASRGVSKDIFGVGENPTFGQQNPNLAEIYLGFCTFVRRLGGVHATTATLEILEGGEAKTAFDGEPKALSPSPFPGQSSALHHSKEAARVLEEGTGPISLVVEGNLREDLLDTHLASRLRRACRDVELSLTPDRVCGLPVWSQDIRWSLLGHALAPARSVAPAPASAECRSCYLEWMEVKLQMCMNEEIDALPGLYGYHVTGRRRPSLAPTSQRGAQGRGATVDEAAAADVERCRSVDTAFAAAMEAEAAVGKRERGGRDRESKDAGAEDKDVAMGGASSDSLCDTDDEDIDGAPMIQGVQPPHATPPCSDQSLAPPISSLRSPASNTEPGKHGGSGATDLTGKDLVVAGAGDVGVSRTSGVSDSVADAGKINAVLAHGDRVMKAVAKAVAAAAAKAGGAGGKYSSAAGSGAGGDGSGDRTPAEKSKEEEERARTKALAKERGRERGKQRERERVAEAEVAKEKAREEEAARERRRRKREDQDRMRAERRDERISKDKVDSDVDGGKLVDGRRAADRDTASRSKLAAVRTRERNAPTSRSSVRRRGSSLRSSSSSSSGRGKSTSGESDGSSASRNIKVRGVDGSARTTRSKRDGSRTARSSRSPSGDRRRTRTGWSDEGRDSNRGSRGGSSGDPSRGSNRGDRSLPPRSNARDAPGKTGEAKEKTQKVAEKEKRNRQKELPTSTVWSEWRSVSSDDSDDDLSPSAAGAKTGRGVIRSVTASGEDGGMGGFRIRLKRGPSLERPPEINAVAKVAVEKAAVVKTAAVVEAAVAKGAVCATELPGNSEGHRATTSSGGSAGERQQQSEGGNSDVSKSKGKNAPSSERSRRGGAGDSKRTSSPRNSRGCGRSPRSGDDDSGRARSRSNSHAPERLSKIGGNARQESYRTTSSHERSRRGRGSDSRREPSRSNSGTRGRSTKSGSKVIEKNSRRTPSHERKKRDVGSDNRRAPYRSNSRTRERSAKSGGGDSRRASSRSNSRAREMSRSRGNVGRESDCRASSRERSRRGGNENRRVFSRSKSRGRGPSSKNGGIIIRGSGPRTPSPDRRKHSGDSGGGSGTIQGRNRLATPRSRSRSFERRNRRRSRSRSCNSRRRSPSGQRRPCGRNKSHSREIRTAGKESPSRVEASKKKDAVEMAARVERSATSSGTATTAPWAGEGDNSTDTGKRKVHRGSIKVTTDVDSGEEGELREDPSARAAAASRATVTRLTALRTDIATSSPRVAVATKALAAGRINIETAGSTASSPRITAPIQATITDSTVLSSRVTALTSATTGDSTPSPRVAAPAWSATTGGTSSSFRATAPTQATATVDTVSSPRVTAPVRALATNDPASSPCVTAPIPVATADGAASSSRVTTPTAALTKGSVASSPRITVSTQASTEGGTASSPRFAAPTRSSTTRGAVWSPCVTTPTQTATTDGAARLRVTVTTQAVKTCDAASSPVVTVPNQVTTVGGVAPCPCVTTPNQATIVGAVSNPCVMAPIRTVKNTGVASSSRVAAPTPAVTMSDAASSSPFTALTQAVTAGGAASIPRTVDSARAATTEGDASSSCIAAPTQVVTSGGAASSPRITAPTQVATTGRATSIPRVTAPTRSTTTGSAASIPCIAAPTQAATTDGAARFRVAVTTQATKTSGAASNLRVTVPTQAETTGGAASSPRVTSPSFRSTAQTQAMTTGGAVSNPRVVATTWAATTGGVALSSRVTTPGQAAKTCDAASSQLVMATIQAATTGHAASSPRVTALTRPETTSGAALSPCFKATTKSGTASSPRVTVETQAVTTGGAASSPPVMVLPQAATTGGPALSPRSTTPIRATTRTAGGTVWSPRATVTTKTARMGGATSSPRVMTPTRAASSDGAASSPQVTVPTQVVTTDGVASGSRVTAPTGGHALSSLFTTPIRATTTIGATSDPRVPIAAVMKQEQDNAGVAGEAGIEKVKREGDGAFARGSVSSIPWASASLASIPKTLAAVPPGAADRFSFVPRYVAQPAVAPAILVVGSVPPGSPKTTGAVLGKSEFAGPLDFEKEPGEIERGEVVGKCEGTGTPAVWYSGGMAPAVETPTGAAQAALSGGRQPRKKPRARGKKRLRSNGSGDKNPNANVPVLSTASHVAGARKKRKKLSASLGHPGAAAQPPRQGGSATYHSAVALPAGQATAGSSSGPSVVAAQRSYAATARLSHAPPPKNGDASGNRTSGLRPPRGQGVTACDSSAAPLQRRDTSAVISVVATHQKQCDGTQGPPGGDAATSHLVDLSKRDAIGATGRSQQKGATAPSVCPPQRLDATYCGLAAVDPRTKDHVTVTGTLNVGYATIGGVAVGGGGGDGAPSNPALQHGKQGAGGEVTSAAPRPQHQRGAAGGPLGPNGGTQAPPPRKQKGTKKVNGDPGSSSSGKSAVPLKRGKNWIRNQKRKKNAANRQPGMMDPGEHRAKRTKREDTAHLRCDHPTCRRRVGHSTEDCFIRKREAGEMAKRSRHPGQSGSSNVSTATSTSGPHASSS